MPIREDCLHYESRTYDDDGEVARFCTLDLAPEAPWRCPEHCPRYERLVTGDFDAGSLAHVPPVEPEPDARPEDIAAVLDDAELAALNKLMEGRVQFVQILAREAVFRVADNA